MQDAHCTPVAQAPQAFRIDELYAELHRRAAALMSTQPSGHLLQATALVHEAWLRVARDPVCHDRRHLLARAAAAMRSVLVDHARRQDRAKRRADGRRVPLDENVAAARDRAHERVCLDETLQRLERIDPEMARAVELRVVNAWTIEETARGIGMSKRTFERRWRQTRDWFLKEVG